MQPIPNDRILHLHGTPYEVGYGLGKSLQHSLADDITHYLQAGPLKFGSLTLEALQQGALPWFEALPPRFQEEMQGLAHGSRVPLAKIAEWGFADAGGKRGCSGFILQTKDGYRIGRNNDLWTPDLWGYAILRQVRGRLSTLTLGMRGEIFAATGLNESGLWLHYNWLPAFDPAKDPAWTPYVLLTEILETCEFLDEVEAVLRGTRRTGSMLIFGAEGRHKAACLLECAPDQVMRRDCDQRFLAGTNHYQWLATPHPPEEYAPNSVARLKALMSILTSLPDPADSEMLKAILSDPRVEQHQPDGYGTVCAALYHPTEKRLLFTFGGFPAASRGHWRPLPWPFQPTGVA